jgi:hypothetical protein
MKPLLLLPALTFFINAAEMSPMEHRSIHTYNYRPALKKSGEKNAHKLHKIDEKQARLIAENHCKEKGVELTLTHSGRTLYYIAATKHCTIAIDALDGTVKAVDTKMGNKNDRKEK